MFSFVGDTVLDPFSGIGSTTLAAIAAGRNSTSNEVDPHYLNLSKRRIASALRQTSLFPGASPTLIVETPTHSPKRSS
jgi:site-specific DNA-methyltransferase (adenine-specific)